MPSFPSISNGQLANGMRTSYISQTAFNADFFQYTTTQNPTTFVTTGALSAVTGATSGTCPAGRVLRDNGKRLYPSAHPGVTTYMVGVLDPVSFLSGFIDPNSPVFAVYNGNKPPSLDTTALAQGVNPNGGGADLAPTVYTRGNIETTNGDLLVDAGSATVYGNISATTGSVTAGTSIDAGTFISGAPVTVLAYNTGLPATLVPYDNVATACDIFINPNLGNVFVLNLPNTYTNLTANINVYMRSTSAPSTNITVNPGQIFTLIIYNRTGGSGPDVAWTNATTGMYGTSQANLTNGYTYTYTFATTTSSTAIQIGSNSIATVP